MAWTPATNGPVTAQVIVAPVRHPRDLAKWKGKVKGKIVLITFPEAPKDETNASFKRLDDAAMSKLSSYDQPFHDPEASRDSIQNWIESTRDIWRFFADEGAVALVKMSGRGHGRTS